MNPLLRSMIWTLFAVMAGTFLSLQLTGVDTTPKARSLGFRYVYTATEMGWPLTHTTFGTHSPFYTPTPYRHFDQHAFYMNIVVCCVLLAAATAGLFSIAASLSRQPSFSIRQAMRSTLAIAIGLTCVLHPALKSPRFTDKYDAQTVITALIVAFAIALACYFICRTAWSLRAPWPQFITLIPALTRYTSLRCPRCSTPLIACQCHAINQYDAQ